MSTGYIVIPNGVNRHKYVSTCYKKLRVAVLSTSGASYFGECIITKEALSNVKFPFKAGELGTPVVYLEGDYPIVIGTTTSGDELGTTHDAFYSQKKEWNGCIANVSVDAKSKTVVIDIQDDAPTNILILSKGSEESIIEIESSGQVCVRAARKITIESIDEIALVNKNLEKSAESILSITDNINAQVIDKFIINKGDQAMVRGNELKDRLQEMNENIMRLKEAMQRGMSSVIPRDGGAAAFTAMNVAASFVNKVDLEKINSEIGFIE